MVFHLDDTDGYFVVGGGEFVEGIEGYYGPVVYYRNRVLPQSEVSTLYGQKDPKGGYQRI